MWFETNRSEKYCLSTEREVIKVEQPSSWQISNGCPIVIDIRDLWQHLSTRTTLTTSISELRQYFFDQFVSNHIYYFWTNDCTRLKVSDSSELGRDTEWLPDTEFMWNIRWSHVGQLWISADSANQIDRKSHEKMKIFQNELFSVKSIYKLPLVTNFQARSVPELGRDTISLPDPLGFAET